MNSAMEMMMMMMMVYVPREPCTGYEGGGEVAPVPPIRGSSRNVHCSSFHGCRSWLEPENRSKNSIELYYYIVLSCIDWGGSGGGGYGY